MDNNYTYDAFVILTDNETWSNNSNPYAKFNEYRQTMNPNAKLIIVALTSNGFTIGSPEDRNVLDCVGFDTNTPQVISAFLNDQI
jgi:60 kDa SS-A/Ro ribonucleoprotein